MSTSGSDDNRSNVRRNKPDLNNDRPRFGPPPPKPAPKKPPQQIIDDFWAGFISRFPGKIATVLPDNYYAKRLAQRPDADEGSHNAVESYEEAKRICEQKVDKIVRDCKRVNQKYRDPHFDIERDFYQNSYQECLAGLIEKKNDPKLEPKSTKRVRAIFQNPEFFIKGATANDVRQGRNGDCWLMSALGTVSNCEEPLIERICVARNEDVGVYGFVFHRDGAWISEVVDDKLYLMNEDFYDRRDRDDLHGGINNWMQVQNPRDIEKEYKKRFQTGSKALYFAQCSDPNETWLPLLEKAFAKAHGDYLAVEGGFVGEAIEDLTGGVTSELHGTDILDRDAFWEKELSQVNKQFLFGCGQSRGSDEERNGIQHRHAYSVMEAREVDGFRLLKLRNPWGHAEWTGAWSDGSEEWTAEWMQKLGHKFGNDGVFWISYDDLLSVYQHFDRTRLFDQTWKVTQRWVSLQIPWSIDYHDTHFLVTVEQVGDVVIVLCQLDDRYFRGLEGPYNFNLHFRVHKQGESDYLVRSPSSYNMRRSISTEVFLEPGVYVVMIKIVASRIPFKMTTEDVVRLAATRNRRDKLLAMGLSRDLAYAKVQVKEHDEAVERHEKKTRRSKRKEEEKKAKERMIKMREKDRRLKKRARERLEAKKRALNPEPLELGDVLPAHLSPNGLGRGEPAIDERGDVPLQSEQKVLASELGIVGDLKSGPEEQDTVEGAANPGTEPATAEEMQKEPQPQADVAAAPPSQSEAQDFSSNDPERQQVGEDNSMELCTTKHDESKVKSGVEASPPALGRQETAANDERPIGVRRRGTLPIREPLPPPPPLPRFGPPSRQQTGLSNAFTGPSRRQTEVGDPFTGMAPRELNGWQQGGYGAHPPPPGSEYPPFGRQDTFTSDQRYAGDELDFRDLSWDSELDGPSDTDEEAPPLRVGFNKPSSPPHAPPMGLDLDIDEFPSEPWNAVCVIGLRVYANVGNDVRVEVARPDGMEAKGQEVGREKQLDRDHPAVDHMK